METFVVPAALLHDLGRPYSLGKSVEWKLREEVTVGVSLYQSPYSLGKSVEWKQTSVEFHLWRFWRPYSLGKSVEWKLRQLLNL